MGLLGKLKTIARRNGYVIYTRPYELNIWGVRSPQTRAGAFDDHIHVFYTTGKNKVGILQWEYHVFRVTTDPGTYWLNNPLMPQGSAILAQGQYLYAYEIGLHRGEYEALVQRKNVKVIRDYNRDSTLDFFNGNFHVGMFGINIHRALRNGITPYIEKFSAGCQVFENPSDFNTLMTLAKQHRSIYGNRFTYTLIDERAMRRAFFRRTFMGAVALGVSAGTLYYLLASNDNQEKQPFINN